MGRVDEAGAEQCDRTGAGIDGRTAANADDHVPAAAIERGADELACAVRARDQRIALLS